MTSSNSPENWSACPSGELSRLSSAAKRKQRQKRTVGVVSTVLAGAACTWLLISFTGSLGRSPNLPLAPQPFNLSSSGKLCEDILDRSDQYLLGTLDAEERQWIRAHLQHCPDCEVAYRQRAEELKVDFVAALMRPANPAPPGPLDSLAVK